MAVFSEKRVGERIRAGCEGRIRALQKRKKGQIFMEKSAELCRDSAGALAEYGEKVKEKLGGYL